jgi:hypothetical protein
VLARAERPYGPADIEMGDILGAFVARAVTSMSRADAERPREREAEEETSSPSSRLLHNWTSR